MGKEKKEKKEKNEHKAFDPSLSEILMPAPPKANAAQSTQSNHRADYMYELGKTPAFPNSVGQLVSPKRAQDYFEGESIWKKSDDTKSSYTITRIENTDLEGRQSRTFSVKDADGNESKIEENDIEGHVKIPSWACDSDAQEVCEDGCCCYDGPEAYFDGKRDDHAVEGHRRRVGMLMPKTFLQAELGVVASVCSIPAWRYAALEVMLSWIFWAAFPVIVYMSSACDETQLQTKLVSVSWRVWMIFILLLPCLLCLEWKAHSFILPAWSRFLGPYKVLGYQPSFNGYAFFVMMLSVVTHTDLATNGMILGKLWRTAECSPALMETAWEFQHSAMPWLPSLKYTAVCIWVLMSLQLILGLGYSVPCRVLWRVLGYTVTECQDPYSVGSLIGQSRPPRTFEVKSSFALGLTWPTLFDKTVFAFRSLNALAYAGRMNMLLFRDRSYMERAYLTAITRAMEHHEVERVKKYLWLLTNMLLYEAVRGAMVLVLEIVPSLQLQGLVLGLTKMTTFPDLRASGSAIGNVDVSVAISIIISMLSATYTLYFYVQVVAKNIRLMVWIRNPDDGELAMTHAGSRNAGHLAYAQQRLSESFALDSLEQREESEDIQEHLMPKLYRRVAISGLVAATTAIVGTASLGYVGLQVYHAFSCKLGVWNLADGCIDHYPPQWSHLGSR